jgi:precorrin isomerase
VASGITRRFLPADNPVIVTLNDPKTPEMARNLGTTRSAAAVDLWRPHLQGALVVIGNAPTALFRLLEIIAEGGPRPAAIIGIPVGFVGAAESKALLAETADDIPFLVVHGTRGGSAMASSVVNAAALLAGETRQNLGTAS